MIANYKKYKIGIVVAFFIIIFVLPIYSASLWEGSAALGDYGIFPFTGNYGASNSFVQNSYVEVENLENGKKTRLIIVDRLADDGLLMLISNDAAKELGVTKDDIAKIRVKLISVESSARAPVYDDIAFNPDPDINASASLLTTQDLIPSRPEEPADESAETVNPPAEETEKVSPEKIEDNDITDEEMPISEIEDPVTEPEEDEIADLSDQQEITEAPQEISEPEKEEAEDIVQETETTNNDTPINEDTPIIEDLSPVENLIADEEIPVSDIPIPQEKNNLSDEVNSVSVDSAEPESSIDQLPVLEDSSSYEELPIVEAKSDEESPAEELPSEEKTVEELPAEELPSEELPAEELPIVEEMVKAEKPDSTNELLPVNPLGLMDNEDEAGEDQSQAEEPAIAEEATDEGQSQAEEPAIAEEATDEDQPQAEEPAIVEEATDEDQPQAEEPAIVEEATDEEQSQAEEPAIAEEATDEEQSQAEEPVITEDEADEELEQSTEVELITAKPSAPDGISLVTMLIKKKHYLQVGAFNKKSSAFKEAEDLVKSYPITIFLDEYSSEGSYKLLVGPLTEDESGAMLYAFRSGKYPDAYIRKVD